jgi:hypothetical protein
MNPSVQKGVTRVIESVPKWLKQEIGIEADDAQLTLGSIQPHPKVSIGSDILNLTKPNYNANVTNDRDKHADFFVEKRKAINRRNYKRPENMDDTAGLSRKELRERGL